MGLRVEDLPKGSPLRKVAEAAGAKPTKARTTRREFTGEGLPVRCGCGFEGQWPAVDRHMDAEKHTGRVEVVL